MSKATPPKTSTVPLLNMLVARFPFQSLSYAYYFSQPRVILMEQLKLAYIPIPKIAHTSIKRAIAKIPEDKKIKIHQVPFKNVPLKDFDPREYYTFSFVRNPLMRLISLYERNVNEEYPQHLFHLYGNTFKHKMSFTDFVTEVCNIPDNRADKHFRSQHWFLELEKDIVPDFIGRFENMESDWEILNKKYDLGSIQKHNASSKVNIESYFTPKTLDLVLKRYQKDITLFGYEKEIEVVFSNLFEKEA
ncbi:MAG: sulfotransferase family 2 domain-containing protein [Cytophagia bacterium]|nr:sulfotransferase family 2 domain-containing protein [Cytophagia bacterium]